MKSIVSHERGKNECEGVGDGRPVAVFSAPCLHRRAVCLCVAQLAVAPEWYHALTSNCFTNVVDMMHHTLLRKTWPHVTSAFVFSGVAGAVR